MRRGLIHLLAGAAACAPLACLGQLMPVSADNGFAAGVGTQAQYDSNVQRMASSAGAGSWVEAVSVDADYEKEFGRHRVRASADVGRVFYSEFPVYDYTPSRLFGDWSVKLPHDANAGVELTRWLALARFGDLNSARRDIISRNEAKANFDVGIAGVWRLLIGGDAQRQRNSNDIDKPADFDLNEVDGGIRYRTGSDNQIDLLVRNSRATYPQAAASALVSPYRERGADLKMSWRFSGASTLKGRIGYVTRHNDRSRFPDFSGAAYDLTYLWQPTTRSSLSLLALRQTGATGDNQYLSSVVRTYRLTPAYRATEKLQFQAQFELDQYHYLPVANTAGRSDNIHSMSLLAIWTPRRWLQVKAEQTWELRSSDQSLFDYADRVSSIGIQATF